MTVIFFRTIIIYILLSVTLRVMGKRQVGELEVSELVSTLLLSEIAAMPIDDPDIPFLYAIVPILFIFAVEIIITYLKNRWEPLKQIFESKPVILMEKGKINQNRLLKMRISINELLSEFRLQGVTDIEDVDYAILEQNGNLAVLLKPDKQPLTPAAVSGETGEPMHPVILGGRLDCERIRSLGITEERILKLCRKNGCKTEDVFLLTLADSGKYRLIKKETK